MGALLLWALLALALGVFSTSAAIMLLMPVFVAGVLFAIVAFSQLYRSALAREVAYIGAAFSSGSFDPSPAVTVGLGLVTSTLAPLFALSQD